MWSWWIRTKWRTASTSGTCAVHLGALKRSAFLDMAVSTAWAFVSILAAVVMRGKAPAAVGVAIYNQLVGLQGTIAMMQMTKDNLAQTVPEFGQVVDLINISVVTVSVALAENGG